ncbi:MAG: hypothetical protein IKR26_00595 [Lachnospiraceae bacterium]|nr:hypothetical protein [Lachnospiraceae bacterium]
MKEKLFNDTEKITMFNEIASHFYCGNFGQMSKTDFELMMFHLYYKKLKDTNTDSEGYIDYKKCSDYKISKELGITQQRIRNLKIRDHLIYDNDEDNQWKKRFAKLISAARHENNKVIVNIPDPVLFLEIKNYIEEIGGYIEIQLNSSILQMRAEYFFQLAVLNEEKETQNRIIKELRSHFNEKNEENAVFEAKNIGKKLINLSIDIASVLENIATVISPGNYIGRALLSLFGVGS